MSGDPVELMGEPFGIVDGITAAEAAQRIRVWHDHMRATARHARAWVFACAWVIRRQHPDRGAFDAFVDAELAGVMTSDHGWLAAGAWEAARSSADLRRLVMCEPEEAMEFVRAFVEAGEAERLADLDDDDRVAVEVLSAPPRARRARLRKLLEAERFAEDGRSPEDVKRIEALTEERDAARAALAEAGAAPAATDELIADLQRLESEAAAGAERFPRGASAAQRERALRTVDLIVGHMERISEACVDAGSGPEWTEGL